MIFDDYLIYFPFHWF